MDPDVGGSARMLRTVGDETRLRILLTLAGGECTVGRLAARMSVPVTTMSDHLSTLKSAGLVAARREGKQVHYRLGDHAHASGPAAVEVRSAGLAVRIGWEGESARQSWEGPAATGAAADPPPR